MFSWFSFLKNLFGSPEPAVPVPPAKPASPAPPQHPDEAVALLLEEHNTFRRNNGVQPLSLSEPLNQAAQAHADWMACNRDMDHDEIPGTPGFLAEKFYDRVKSFHYLMRTGGENVAAGQRDVPAVMDAWMHSMGHRANIVNADYWNVGFGVARDALGNLFWCAVFATPLSRGVLMAKYVVTVNLPKALVVDSH